MPKSTFKWVDGSINLDPTPEIGIGADAEHRGGQWDGSTYSGVKSSINANLSTLKTQVASENGFSKLTVEGPGAGAELGASTHSGVAAMIEARAAQATGEIGPVFATAGLNANTGVRLNGEGFQVSVLGFGINLGVGGRFSLDTPVGSLGAATQTLKHENRNREMLYN